MDNKTLDYNSILKDLGILDSPIELAIKNLNLLEEHYSGTELINIYNYALLNIKSPEILTQVIKLTDTYKDNSTLEILLSFLKTKITDDLTINLKVLTIKAISNYKDYSTVTSLLDCLNNKNEHYKVRLACADALGRIGNKYAVKPLIDLVEDEEEKSVYLKESATFALGILGDTSAIDPLIAILESKHSFIGKYTFLKEKIVESLGKLNFNNKKILKTLKNSLMDISPIVRINAIEAIMNSGDDNAVEIIKPSLQDENDEVKENALIALYNLIGRDILDEVINLPSYSKFLKEKANDLILEYESDEYNGEEQ